MNKPLWLIYYIIITGENGTSIYVFSDFIDRETQCELYNYARLGSQSVRILKQRGVNLASWIWISMLQSWRVS